LAAAAGAEDALPRRSERDRELAAGRCGRYGRVLKRCASAIRGRSRTCSRPEAKTR